MRADHTNLAALVEAAVAVASQPDLGTVLDTTVQRAKDATGAAFAALGVIGEHGVLIDFKYLGIDEMTARAIGQLPTGRGVLGTLIHHPRPIRLEDLHQHPDSIGFPPNHPPMYSFLGVPIRIGPTVYGNLYLTEKPGGFTEQDQAMVESLAAIAGAAIATARLRSRLTQLALVADRERIARDLHDAVIQDLFGVGLSLQALAMRLDDGDLAAKLTDSVDRLDEAIRSLRSFVFELQTVDVGPSARDHLAGFVAGLPVPDHVVVDVHITPDLGALKSPLLKEIEHIIQEAMSNAVRHSGDDSIEVWVERDPAGLLIVVRDNGHGFDPDTAERGLGLDNMRERAERAGGQMAIESSPGAGTTLQVVLPR